MEVTKVDTKYFVKSTINLPKSNQKKPQVIKNFYYNY